MIEVLIYVIVTALLFLVYVYFSNKKNRMTPCEECPFLKEEIKDEKPNSKRKLLGSPRR